MGITQWYHYIQRYDITQWYAVFSGALMALPMILWILRCGLALAQKHRHRLLKYVWNSKKVTVLEAVLIVVVLSANAFPICFVDSAQMLMSRSGLLSSINIAFLPFGYHMSSLYRSSGLTLTDYHRIHYWAAGISITEALLHSVIAIVLKAWKEDAVSQISTWTALSTIIFVLVSSLSIMTGRYYEAFAITHRFAAVVIIATVWMHTAVGGLDTHPAIYLLVAAGIWVATRCFWLSKTLFRNLNIGHKLASATVEKDGKIMIVSVRLPQPWSFNGGQYIKLCIPGLSWSSLLQWHPFAVSWYEIVNGEVLIRMMVRERKGFTAMLANKTIPDHEMLAFIDGPYGQEIQLRTYGMVLLFASGIGIAGQLLCAKQILEDYDSRNTSCRQIFLFWEIEDTTAYANLIEPYVHELTSHSILELRPIYTRLDIKTEIYTMIQKVPGSIAVITCVSHEAREVARGIRQDLFEKKVHLFELEFCPELMMRDGERKLQH